MDYIVQVAQQGHQNLKKEVLHTSYVAQMTALNFTKICSQISEQSCRQTDLQRQTVVKNIISFLRWG